nr:MAG TPA: hypothetical protein [Caudoviricetes sp.]
MNKINIGEIVKKYNNNNYAFYLVEKSAAIESMSDVREVCEGYTNTSTRHACTDGMYTKFDDLERALKSLAKKYNDYFYDGIGNGWVEESFVEIWRVDEDSWDGELVMEVPCQASNLSDFWKKWGSVAGEEFASEPTVWVI